MLVSLALSKLPSSILFLCSFLSNFFLNASSLTLIWTLSCFCILLNNSLSPWRLIFVAKQFLHKTGYPRFGIREACHFSGGDVIHTEVYVVSHTLSYGIYVLSICLVKGNRIVVSKQPSRVPSASCNHFVTVLFVTVALWTNGLYSKQRKQDCDVIVPEEVLFKRCMNSLYLHKTNPRSHC